MSYVGLDVRVDEMTPCVRFSGSATLREVKYGKCYDRSILRKYCTATGWDINWEDLPKEVEVYGLYVAEDDEVQGLMGLYNDRSADAVYIHCLEAAPCNKSLSLLEKRYEGIGCHLFMMAVKKSIEWGHGGVTYGIAANRSMVLHYGDLLQADYIGLSHRNQFLICEDRAYEIMDLCNACGLLRCLMDTIVLPAKYRRRRYRPSLPEDLIIPKFYTELEPPEDYDAPVDPYKLVAPSKVNLRALSHFADRKKKDIFCLDADEVMMQTFPVHA